MSHSYHNWGLAGAAHRKYGKGFYDNMLMFREMGVLFQILWWLFLLATAVISIPILLIVFLCKRSYDKNTRKAMEVAEQELMLIDVSSNEDFVGKLKDLLLFCVEHKYPFSFPATAEYDFKFVRSIEKLGIKDMRSTFGTEVVLNRALITNRELTSQAQSFCESAYISVLDRNDLQKMLLFKIKKEKALAKG